MCDVLNDAEIELITKVTIDISKGRLSVDSVLIGLSEITHLTEDQLVTKLKMILDEHSFNKFLDYWKISICEDKEIMHMYDVCELETWSDIFHEECCIVDILVSGEFFNLLYDSMSSIVSRVETLQKQISDLRFDISLQKAINTYHQEFSDKLTPPKYFTSQSTPVDEPDKVKLAKLQSVYLITDGKCFKIGIAKNIRSRLSSLQTSNPNRLSLCSVYKPKQATAFYVEQQLHNYFKGYRLSGEWFDVNISEELFQSICSEYDKALA